MSTQAHRWLGRVVVLAYFLASTSLGLWHSHQGHSHRGGPHGCRHAASDPGGCQHDCEEASLQLCGDEHHRDTTPQDECSVCQFLAQSALPVMSVALPTHGDFVAEAGLAPLASPLVWVATGGPARAPPGDA